MGGGFLVIFEPRFDGSELGIDFVDVWNEVFDDGSMG